MPGRHEGTVPCSARSARTPDVSKSKRLLDFEATTPLDKILDEVVPWITEQVRLGAI